MKRNPVLGVALLAIGRGEGIACFGTTPQSFLASLAPLVAFPLVGAGLLLFSAPLVDAVTTLLLTLVAQLAPLVISERLARRWDRDSLWLRYATAFNWCQWAVPVALLALVLVMSILVGAGLPEEAGGMIVLVLLLCWGLWFHWTIARHGLMLAGGRAALLVVLSNFGTVLLVIGPRLLQVLLNGSSE